MRVVDSDFLPQIFPRFFILVRLSPLPHKSILVHSAQKNSHNFIVFAEMMQMEQKIVDFFSIKVYLRFVLRFAFTINPLTLSSLPYPVNENPNFFT